MSKAPANLEVAARLRQARQRIFKSAAAAAEALGAKPGTVRAHENGQNGVGLFELEQYSRRYGVTMDWLITGRGPIEPDHNVNAPGLMNLYGIMGQLRDEVWIAPADNQPEDEWPGWGQLKTPAGIDEEVEYSDTRFPENLIVAMKVRTENVDSIYIDGSIVFSVPSEYTDFNDGDHVITIREKESFCEWSLRKVVFTGRSTRLESLISPSDPYVWDYDDEMPENIHIVGTVIGSLTRRPVPAMPPHLRRLYEIDEANRRKFVKR